MTVPAQEPGELLFKMEHSKDTFHFLFSSILLQQVLFLQVIVSLLRTLILIKLQIKCSLQLATTINPNFILDVNTNKKEIAELPTLPSVNIW